jgi:tetratricopeptide (TPR) repeat protein
MSRPKNKAIPDLIDQMQGEASWLLSHAQALADYGRKEEAAAEWVRAAACAEELACLLETNGEERQAAVQRVSAASCHEKLGQHARAVTLLHAALASALPDDYRARVEQQLARCLTQAQMVLRQASIRRARKAAPAAP